jgi:hypothetical protein
MPDQTEIIPDPSGERTRIDARTFKEIPLGTLSVDTDGAITIQRPADADAQPTAYNATRAPTRPEV